MSIDTIDRIRDEVINCRLCNLCKNRTNAVPGEGNSNASIMFVGEAPGRNEDEKGRPFVGIAGKILDEILAKVGIVRSRVFVTNIVKCRPPQNRVPTEDEQRICSKYLDREISIISPKIICVLGRTAFQSLIGDGNILGNCGKLIEKDRKLFFITIHPAAIIYNNKLRYALEKDMQTLVSECKRLNIPI
ncbi:MAG TPA: uracil-DNA glycosylase [Nitrososphaeraceae archaeon]